MTTADSIRLNGKVALVTGGGNGIGRETAFALARAGAAVVVNDVSADLTKPVVDAIRAEGARAAPAVANIGSTEAAKTCVATALEHFGRLDILCANAGILRDSVLWKTTDDDFDAVVDTHLRGTFTCARAAVSHMRNRPGGGRLILVSSIAGQQGNFGQTTYSAVKAGIAAMARTWSMELARDGITVNAVVPNAMTAMTATIPALAEHAERSARGDALPDSLRQDFGLGTAADVAPLFVYLASDDAAGISGQAIGIGGDRLSVWSHPAEADAMLSKGGWTAEAISEAWNNRLSHATQSVGIQFDLDDIE